MAATWQKNSFQEVRFTRDIHLGELGQKIAEGSLGEYDGTTLRIDGREVQIPQLRSAFDREWVVLAEFDDEAIDEVVDEVHDELIRGEFGQVRDGDSVASRPIRTVSNATAKVGHDSQKSEVNDGSIRMKGTNTGKFQPTVIESVEDSNDNGNKVVGRVRRPAVTSFNTATDSGDVLVEPEAQPKKISRKVTARKDTPIVKRLQEGQVELPNGVVWDLTISWQDRLNDAKKYVSNKDVFEAIIAAETPRVANILSEYQ